jgi:2-phospho-L-lactate/phosphoenolpyruvate guanylyltransferase
MSDHLSPTLRAALLRALAERTATTAADAGLVPILVAGDAVVAEWAIRNGLASVPDPGSGLDAAAAAGVDWARESASSWLVVHCDLPLLTVGEMAKLAELAPTSSGVIAPSADGGSSAIGGRGEFRFAYGPASFGRHLARAPGMTIVASPGLLHDVDSYRDLTSAMGHPRGRWLREVLG